MRDHGPKPIVDLCHFGVPDWLGEFPEPRDPRALADYAGAFAARYPWVRFYTPVNEMYVCARMSALDGRLERAAARRKRSSTAVLQPRPGERADDGRDLGAQAGRDLRQQ